MPFKTVLQALDALGINTPFKRIAFLMAIILLAMVLGPLMV